MQTDRVESVPDTRGANSILVRFGGIDRLTLRLALGITTLVVILLAAGLYVVSTGYFERTLAARREAVELQNRLLETALRHQMLNRDPTLIADVLREISSKEDVRNAMIVDHDGVVHFSGSEGRVGQRESRSSPTCMVCHSKEAAERQLWTVYDSPEGRVLRSVQPIENRAECHRCHDPAQRMNGMLILDVSLAALDNRLRRDALWMVAATAALGLLLLASIGFLVRRMILIRLARLGDAACSFAAGNLKERAAVEGDDTITGLARDLNRMADAAVRLLTEVRTHEAQLSNVMNSVDDGLVVLDRDLRIVASNRAFCRKVGLHPEAIRGLKCKEAIGSAHPCRTTGGPCTTAECLSKGETQRATFHFPALNGSPGRVEEVHASPVYDDAGQVVQVVEVWRDITERVEEETRLAEFERLETLGVLASGFSHEMNTPLASTLTCAEAILGRVEEMRSADSAAQALQPVPPGAGGDARATSGTGVPTCPGAGENARATEVGLAPPPAPLAETKEYAETIRREVLRCRKITEQFLRFARGIPPSTEPVDLREVILGILPVVGPTARQAGVTIRSETGSTAIIVTANTEVVQHVLLNLLVNAVQSFPTTAGQSEACTVPVGQVFPPAPGGAGGDARATGGAGVPACPSAGEDARATNLAPAPAGARSDRWVEVSLVPGAEVRVRVRDNGPGIPLPARAHLFEPFRTGRRKGTGIGLFLSRRFMRRFGGDVVFAGNGAGTGACFEIVFPPPRSFSREEGSGMSS